MVVSTSTPLRGRKTRAIGIPTIDFSSDMSKTELSETIVRACEEYGFFKLINHGIPMETIDGMENEGVRFFGRPGSEKHEAGPPNPYGYGCKNIGTHGDQGELEYLLLEANHVSIAHRSKTIANNPTEFSDVANCYIQSMRKIACEILELVADGLWLEDKGSFSRLLKDEDSDSCFRINYYPPTISNINRYEEDMGVLDMQASRKTRIGFGEHSDPQILTIMRSNDVGGLQICSPDGLWIPVNPDPSAFFVLVGDVFQALTNGRFMSVRHRVVANGSKSRLSMMYFGAPAYNAWISPPPQMVSPQNPSLYKPFTWGEYKKTLYTLRLAAHRLDFYRTNVINDSEL
ncbi:oxygenase [Lithospermum erythrorhizon]|uniref:gibberellin 2beta-dioxygenase n=1 Tax=Lithospermum erythrorhizon TaxID=34254 RepID=A0AAV3RNM3_LITER